MKCGGVSMICDVLNEYRAFLIKTLRAETARTYANRLATLLKEQNIINTCETIDVNTMIEHLSKIKYKNHFSQSKNALLYFLKFQDIKLDKRQKERIIQLENATKKKYRKLKQQDYKTIKRKIEHLKNKKLKMCFQVLIETGLRVSELSQITPADCIISIDTINLSFLGKGGKKERVTISKKDNPKLYDTIKTVIEYEKSNKKIFYSYNYLQLKAKELGFTCHDLRRLCSKLTYKNTNSKEAVKEKLRHSNIKTTEIYLNSKIKL